MFLCVILKTFHAHICRTSEKSVSERASRIVSIGQSDCLQQNSINLCRREFYRQLLQWLVQDKAILECLNIIKIVLFHLQPVETMRAIKLWFHYKAIRRFNLTVLNKHYIFRPLRLMCDTILRNKSEYTALDMMCYIGEQELKRQNSTGEFFGSVSLITS